MRTCWCARCGQSLTIGRDLQVRRITCGSCGYIQDVPEPVATSRVPRKPGQRLRPGWFDSYALEHSRIQGLSMALLLVSTVDLLMTYVLLRTSHRFYESNPIAQWVFARWNMAGMVVYKFALVAFIISLGEIIERHRPRWGKGILLLGCLVTAYACSHGLRLYLAHLADPHV